MPFPDAIGTLVIGNFVLAATIIALGFAGSSLLIRFASGITLGCVTGGVSYLVMRNR